MIRCQIYRVSFVGGVKISFCVKKTVVEWCVTHFQYRMEYKLCSSSKGSTMPVICFFHGLYISMYFLDNKVHYLPHIHVNFNEYEAVYSIPLGNRIDGDMPGNKERLILKWIGLNQHELMENWSRAIAGLPLKFIEPLK
jgi:hypothetical protein